MHAGYAYGNPLATFCNLPPPFVAQTSSLLYRGFPIRQASLRPERQDLSQGLPTGSRRYSRLEVCATPFPWRRFPTCRIADFQSAKRPSVPSARTCRRVCRLEVGDTADWKSALRPFRGAGFQPAVSRISNPPSVPPSRAPGLVARSADWKSAIQQTGSLRYALSVAQTSSLLYRGFPIRQVSLRPERQNLSRGLPTGSRRYGRLEVCATPFP